MPKFERKAPAHFAPSPDAHVSRSSIGVIMDLYISFKVRDVQGAKEMDDPEVEARVSLESGEFRRVRLMKAMKKRQRTRTIN